MFSNRAQNGKMRARWARKRRKTRAWNLARDLERSSPRQRLRKQEFIKSSKSACNSVKLLASINWLRAVILNKDHLSPSKKKIIASILTQY